MIALEAVGKTYRSGARAVTALRELSLSIGRGEFVAITGPSGSGKSTLMHIIGGLDTPDRGRYLLDGLDMTRLSDNQLAATRNRRIGFVFQSFNLVPRIDALRNVELPLIYAGLAPPQRRALAQAALREVGLADRAEHTPAQLSGGQQQRVAIARALVTAPDLLIADEPTGALDEATGAKILRGFARLNQRGLTVLLVTHDPTVAAYAHRTIRLRDGALDADSAAA